MSTPFPPNSKLRGPAIYAPQRVRGRIFSEDPAEIADASAQTEPAVSETEQLDFEQIEREPAAMADDATYDADAAKDPLDWLDDAIRAVVELNHASDGHEEYDPSVAVDPTVADPHSPSIAPMYDESDDRPAVAAPQRDRVESRNPRPRPPRLETQIVPPPPAPPPERGRLGQILRMSLMIVFAAIVAYGVTRFYPSHQETPQPQDSSDRVADVPSQQAEPQAAPQPPQPSSHLVVGDQQALANDPIALAVNIDHATDNESLLLDGLAQGTTLSAGASTSPSSWQLSPDKLAGLYLYAPKDFVGVMNTTVKLLGPDRQLLDTRAMQLKWIARPLLQAPQPMVASAGNEAPRGVRISPVAPAAPVAPKIRPIDPGEAAMLMQRGRDSLTTGDISAARVAFRRLADAGIPDAALALANTYDPGYLAAHNVVGALGDRAMAYSLYKRARDLGSAEAGQILARMGAN
jgi:hypothetical protein